MSKVSIVYWSGTGNTQKMAEAVAEGVKEAGAEADLKFVSAATVDELAAEPAFALGCPSMGAEELEDAEMEPFMAELESKISGKRSLYSVLTDGAAVNGCVTGKHVFRVPAQPL